jgi:two-component system sensor histidine kinase MtrB
MGAATSGLLALTSYVLFRENRTDVFTHEAREKAGLALLSSPDDLDLDSFNGIVRQLRRRAGFETIAVGQGETYSSSPDLTLGNVPAHLRATLARGDPHTEQTTVAGRRMLVIGGLKRSGLELYFFLDMDEVLASIHTVRNVLLVGWTASVLVSAGIGALVTRRTLRPIRTAAAASRSLAKGALDTRLSESKDEFGTLAASFNQMAASLQGKIDDLSRAAARERQFTSDVAHELRTPTAAIAAEAGLIEDHLDDLPAPARRPVELLIGDVHRLQALIVELLELARLEGGQEVAHPEALVVHEAVAAITWRVARAHPDAAPVVVDVPADLAVLADRARFARVVENLLANAVRHDGVDVVVSAHRDGGWVVLDVADRGPGVPEADLERIFDRFVKADAARSAEGTGLGLAIAREHARLQGGSLTAAQRDGGGMVFRCRLPAAPAPAADGEPSSVAP